MEIHVDYEFIESLFNQTFVTLELCFFHIRVPSMASTGSSLLNK